MVCEIVPTAIVHLGSCTFDVHIDLPRSLTLRWSLTLYGCFATIRISCTEVWSPCGFADVPTQWLVQSHWTSHESDWLVPSPYPSLAGPFLSVSFCLPSPHLPHPTMSEYRVSHKTYLRKYCNIYIADDAPSSVAARERPRAQAQRQAVRPRVLQGGPEAPAELQQGGARDRAHREGAYVFIRPTYPPPTCPLPVSTTRHTSARSASFVTIAIPHSPRVC